MKSYLNLLTDIMLEGEDRTDRTGVGTRSIFGYQWRHDLRDGFPILTTKRIHWRSVVVELLWFLRGNTNVRWLQQRGVGIWDEWADIQTGELGPIYGKQWRSWMFADDDTCGGSGRAQYIDQIATLIIGLKNNPDSRRHIVSAWNPGQVPFMALPPCHTLFQCYVTKSKRLSLHLYARSIDAFLGLPFNIASYALLTHILCRVTGYSPGELIISFGDLHIYSNHFDQVNEQCLRRRPKELPDLLMSEEVGKDESLMNLEFEMFTLSAYDPYPAIKAPVAV